MRVKKDSRNVLISLKCSLLKLWNFLHARKKSFWGSMVSFMTLQNSMDERKLKNYHAFHLSLLSSMSVCICVCVCVCVCVCAGPALCVWSGMEGAVFSVWQWGGLREGEGEGETDKHGLQRLCSHCDLNQMETELHFLTECSKYTDIRRVYYDKIQQIHPTFITLSDQEKLAYLLGEHKTCCVFAAQYVSLCHHRREDTPPERERERERERPAVCLFLNMCLSVTTEEKTPRLPWADVSSTCRLYYDILPLYIT